MRFAAWLFWPFCRSCLSALHCPCCSAYQVTFVIFPPHLSRYVWLLGPHPCVRTCKDPTMLHACHAADAVDKGSQRCIKQHLTHPCNADSKIPKWAEANEVQLEGLSSFSRQLARETTCQAECTVRRPVWLSRPISCCPSCLSGSHKPTGKSQGIDGVQPQRLAQHQYVCARHEQGRQCR